MELEVISIVDCRLYNVLKLFKETSYEILRNCLYAKIRNWIIA